jgi:hypothetical protein
MSEMSRGMSELPVDSHRRLVQEGISTMREFATSTDRRLIELSLSSHDFLMHQQLAARDIPVLPLVQANEQTGKARLLVPNEARTVHATLRFIARDIEGYKPIFAMVGDLLGRCEINNFGLPLPQENQSILSSMAYSIDPNDDEFGALVRLFPPYNFSRDVTKATTLDTVRQELEASGHLNGPATNELIRITSVAWNAVRQ